MAMSKLSREEVLRLARLARLDLTDDEVEEFQNQLGEILQYVEQLQSIDISGLEPTNQVTGLINVMREDTVRDYGYEPRKLLENVPKVQDDMIQVKRMIG